MDGWVEWMAGYLRKARALLLADLAAADPQLQQGLECIVTMGKAPAAGLGLQGAHSSRHGLSAADVIKGILHCVA